MTEYDQWYYTGFRMSGQVCKANDKKFWRDAATWAALMCMSMEVDA